MLKVQETLKTQRSYSLICPLRAPVDPYDLATEDAPSDGQWQQHC